MTLTNKQHVDNEGGQCPFCESWDIEGESLDIEGGVITQIVNCVDCSKEWVDVFTLTSYTPHVRG
jgi:hypothetical protein